MIRGLPPGVTIFVFLLLWAVVFDLLRFTAPHMTKTQFKALAISFGIAFAAFLALLLGFAGLAALG